MKEMKLPLLNLLLLFTMFVYGQRKTFKTPAEITKAFIVDYKEWNDFAMKTDAKGLDTKGNIAEKNYHSLIRKYCGSKKNYQGIAYGTISSHSPDEEKIVDQIIDDSTAMITTKLIDKDGNYSTDYYEYHFIRTKKKWILKEVYYVDLDGKYKSL